ncbi:MAG: arylsulfatase, partial [Aquabacterium sp.]
LAPAWAAGTGPAPPAAPAPSPVVAATAAASAPSTTAPRRPNIVLIVADDWGFSDVGAFGGEIETPHLDALARRGLRFSNFHVAGSCSPTRAMLLTGVQSHRAGVGALRESMPFAHRGQPGYEGSLNQRVVSVATLLRDAGYRTYAAGKWNVGSEPGNRPDQRGFDRSIVQGDTGSDNWQPDKRYLPTGPQVDWFEDGRPATMPARFYSSTYFVDRMIGYLQPGTGSDKPFFAYVAFQANHVPVQAPQAFIDKYRGSYDAGWHAVRQARRERIAAMGLLPRDAAPAATPMAGDWAALTADERRYQARLMEVYAAMADAMDHEVGRLVAHLKASGDFENTVFVFLSDNGPEGSDYKGARLWLSTQYARDLDRLGGPGAYAVPGPGWATASASPLGAYKFHAGEGALRVPLIIAGPAVARPGAVHAGLTHVTDIAPTLLDLARVPSPAGRHQGRAVEPMRGHSLMPLLAGADAPVRAADAVLGYELSGSAALFKGPHKLVRNLPPFGDGGWRLFDIQADPGETLDLQARQPALFNAMQADYAAWAREHGVLPVPDGYDPQRQVSLNVALNYFLPTYGPWAAAVLLLAATGGVMAWRRRKAAATARRP